MLNSESLSNVWQIWVDSQQNSECEISFTIPSIISFFGGKGHEETVRWAYHGIKTAESIIRQGRPKNGTIFLLEGSWKPKVDVGRSVIRELPIEALLVIETIIYKENIRLPYQKRAEKALIYKLNRWEDVSLSEWRTIRESQLGKWIYKIEYKYIENVKNELNMPVNTYPREMNISGKNRESSMGMNKYLQAYLQDNYIITVNYRDGQVLKFVEKPEGTNCLIL